MEQHFDQPVETHAEFPLYRKLQQHSTDGDEQDGDYLGYELLRYSCDHYRQFNAERARYQLRLHRPLNAPDIPYQLRYQLLHDQIGRIIEQIRRETSPQDKVGMYLHNPLFLRDPS